MKIVSEQGDEVLVSMSKADFFTVAKNVQFKAIWDNLYSTVAQLEGASHSMQGKSLDQLSTLFMGKRAAYHEVIVTMASLKNTIKSVEGDDLS